MTRRRMLSLCSNGFGSLALLGLMGSKTFGNVLTSGKVNPLSPQPSHFEPKAKNVIFLYMDGGVSHVDTFDPKPLLAKENGNPMKMKIEPTQFNNNGGVLKSPWEFKRYGQSGIEVSDLFPHVATCVDNPAIIRSMVSEFSEHTNANYFLHTGHGLQGRPSVGAWVSYGLGSENQNLPGFVVLNGGLIPSGGLDNFNNGFLPAYYQGSIFQSGESPIANINKSDPLPKLQRNKLDFVRQLDKRLLGRVGHTDEIESAITNYELAYRMQDTVPELTDLRGESKRIKKLYGFDATYAHTRTYARQCLIARRLVERGVRFIELTCPMVDGYSRWDQHENLKGNHYKNALAVDQPIAALLMD